jgi:hypothetical protein
LTALSPARRLLVSLACSPLSPPQGRQPARPRQPRRVFPAQTRATHAPYCVTPPLASRPLLRHAPYCVTPPIASRPPSRAIYQCRRSSAALHSAADRDAHAHVPIGMLKVSSTRRAVRQAARPRARHAARGPRAVSAWILPHGGTAQGRCARRPRIEGQRWSGDRLTRHHGRTVQKSRLACQKRCAQQSWLVCGAWRAGRPMAAWVGRPVAAWVGHLWRRECREGPVSLMPTRPASRRIPASRTRPSRADATSARGPLLESAATGPGPRISVAVTI